MSSSLIDHFSSQTRIAVGVTNRDAFKRLSAGMLIMIVYWLFGNKSDAYFWSGMIVCSEILARIMTRKIDSTGSQLSFAMCLAILTLNLVSLWPLMMPALFFAGHGSDALLVAGLIWLLGIQLNISNSYAGSPIFSWSMLVPAFAVTILVFWQAYTAPSVASTEFELAATIVILIVYAANNFQTMSVHKDALLNLAKARKSAAKRLSEYDFLTRHDLLTGIMNRRAFEEAATALLPKRNNWDCKQLGYFLIDLDGFKPINESYGHQVGDTVLVHVADRLNEYVGGTGVVARLSGNEFAAAITDVRSSAQAQRLATEMVNLLKQPIVFDQKHLTVGANVGVAVTTSSHDSLIGVASGADQAMHKAKNDPERCAFVYDKDSFPVKALLDDRVTILRAIQKRNIAPYYQPKINLKTGFIEGFEALSRWRHPTHGLLLPRRFLSFVDDLGLQNEFLIRTTGLVLQQIEDWIQEGLEPGEVSVNIPKMTLATLSGRDSVLRLIEKFPRARLKLTFEVSDDASFARSEDVIHESITEFRNAGIRISLDDFGIGFSSFKHLSELEFDELKIGKQFVHGLGQNNATKDLIEGFLVIGKGLGMQVIAEGVETETQRMMLRKMGCTLCQGFYYSPAIPHKEASDALRRQKNFGAPFAKFHSAKATEAESAA